MFFLEFNHSYLYYESYVIKNNVQFRRTTTCRFCTPTLHNRASLAFGRKIFYSLLISSSMVPLLPLFSKELWSWGLWFSASGDIDDVGERGKERRKERESERHKIERKFLVDVVFKDKSNIWWTCVMVIGEVKNKRNKCFLLFYMVRFKILFSNIFINF